MARLLGDWQKIASRKQTASARTSRSEDSATRKQARGTRAGKMETGRKD
jgi:hypothetical protein